ncbi:MAG: hypothetical protein AAGD35_11965 [Actinomycetota bacterium]
MHEPSPVEHLLVDDDAPSIAPRAGDLLFGNRACTVQTLMTLASDQWTHCAIVAGSDPDPNGGGGSLRTVELGPRGLLSRTVEEFLDRYRLVGIARPDLSDICRSAVVTAALARLHLDDVDYSWPHCFVIGSTGFLRRFAPGRTERGVVRAGLGAARRIDGPRTATCSSLIDDLLDHACDHCRPATTWPSRPRVPPWQARPSATDVVGLDGAPPASLSAAPGAARALIAPADLWVGAGYAMRAVMSAERTTVLRDLRSPHRRRPCDRHVADEKEGGEP